MTPTEDDGASRRGEWRRLERCEGDAADVPIVLEEGAGVCRRG